jgi:hypothetical protein
LARAVEDSELIQFPSYINNNTFCSFMVVRQLPDAVKAGDAADIFDDPPEGFGGFKLHDKKSR